MCVKPGQSITSPILSAVLQVCNRRTRDGGGGGGDDFGTCVLVSDRETQLDAPDQGYQAANHPACSLFPTSYGPHYETEKAHRYPLLPPSPAAPRPRRERETLRERRGGGGGGVASQVLNVNVD